MKTCCFSVHNCVLGGTHQTDDFNRSIVEEDTDFVLNGCTELMPGLKVCLYLLSVFESCRLLPSDTLFCGGYNVKDPDSLGYLALKKLIM